MSFLKVFFFPPHAMFRLTPAEDDKILTLFWEAQGCSAVWEQELILVETADVVVLYFYLGM